MIYVLSGGGTKLFAAIGVTYPEGSTCTCTNGTKTLKAKNTNGQWVFAIPEKGEWTVSCTDGTDTDSQSVSITAEGQSVKLELSYALFLYKSGKGALVDFDTFKEGNASVSVTADKITTGFTSSGGYQIACITKNKLDLTGFNLLTVVANCTELGPESDYKGILGVFTGDATAEYLASSKNSVSEVIAKTNFTVKNGEFNLDITNINGEYKVGIKGGLKSTITEIKLGR